MAAAKAASAADAAPEAVADAAPEPVAPVAEAAALQDKPSDPQAVSAAPPRPHDGIVGQLSIRWAEMKAFVSELEGDVEGELGDLLAFVRAKL